MLKILGVTIGLAVGFMIFRQLPDIQRYLKIRSM